MFQCTVILYVHVFKKDEFKILMLYTVYNVYSNVRVYNVYSHCIINILLYLNRDKIIKVYKVGSLHIL